MITSSMAVGLGYTLSLLVFYMSSDIFLFWVMMELNLLLFLGWNMFLEGKLVSNYMMYIFYFIVQSIGSILFIISFLFDKFGMSVFSSLLFIFSLTVKVGLYPSSFWVFQMGKHMSLYNFYFLLVIQKIPLFILLFSFSGPALEMFLVASMVFSSICIFSSYDFKDVLICSSISSTFWFLFIFSQSIFMFSLFMLVYSISFFFISESMSLVNNLLSKMVYVFSFIFLSGLPPVSLFFFKVGLVSSMSFNSSSMYELLAFWVFTMGILGGYWKSFHKNFFFSNFLYHNYDFSFKNMSFLMGSFLLSLFFLI